MLDAERDQAKLFISMSDEDKKEMLAKMRKALIVKLLQNVAIIAVETSDGITSHPFLVQANRQIKVLKEKLADKPNVIGPLRDLVKNLESCVEHLGDGLSRALNKASYNLELCATAQKKNDVLKQEHEAETKRLLEFSNNMTDDWNRLKNELEQANKVIAALIRSRNSHVAVAIIAKAALIVDMELVKLGLDFNVEEGIR